MIKCIFYDDVTVDKDIGVFCSFKNTPISPIMLDCEKCKSYQSHHEQKDCAAYEGSRCAYLTEMLCKRKICKFYNERGV